MRVNPDVTGNMNDEIESAKRQNAGLRGAVTMADVARRAGVSKMTVSRLLVNETLVAEDARKRIRTAIDELDYIPDRVAGALSSGRSGFVALLVPSLNSTHFLQTARGLTEVLSPHGLQILLGYTDYSVDREEQLIETMLRRRPEAMVVTGGTHTERARKILARAKIPVIETWDMPRQPVDRVVGFSNAAAAALMADHFAGMGFQEVAFLGGPAARDPRGRDRQAGFAQRARALGLTVHELNFGEEPISIEGGRLGISAVIEKWPGVRAVMCVFDLCAFGAMNEMLMRGKKVPGDIAIAGFGNFEIAQHSLPPLTSIHIDAVDIGRSTGNVIASALGLALPGEGRVIEMPVRLIIRPSTSPASQAS